MKYEQIEMEMQYKFTLKIQLLNLKNFLSNCKTFQKLYINF